MRWRACLCFSVIGRFFDLPRLPPHGRSPSRKTDHYFLLAFSTTLPPSPSSVGVSDPFSPFLNPPQLSFQNGFPFLLKRHPCRLASNLVQRLGRGSSAYAAPQIVRCAPAAFPLLPFLDGSVPKGAPRHPLPPRFPPAKRGIACHMKRLQTANAVFPPPFYLKLPLSPPFFILPAPPLLRQQSRSWTALTRSSVMSQTFFVRLPTGLTLFTLHIPVPAEQPRPTSEFPPPTLPLFLTG